MSEKSFMFAIAAGVNPQNYLSCLAERNRALHLHDRITNRLCSALQCNRRDLDMAILKERASAMMPHGIYAAIAELYEAELFLDKTSTLLEIAEDIRAAQVNADLQNIEC